MPVTNRKLLIEELNYGHTLQVMLSDIRILWAGLSTFWTILIDFFFIQSPLRPRPFRQQCVNIDHPLDNNIPFSPKWVGEYLKFIQLWTGSIAWLRIHFGKKGIRPAIQSLKEIQKLYKSAAVVYRRCQSTTTRPHRIRGNAGFTLIHATDPHLNCLPSLHVMIVTWAGSVLSDRILALRNERRENEAVSYIRRQAKLITESTLYVKQHSINCIPAALFTMKQLFTGFEKTYGEKFINSLFDNTAPEVKDRLTVTTFMNSLYHSFVQSATNGQRYTDVLLNYLAQYKKEQGLNRSISLPEETA